MSEPVKCHVCGVGDLQLFSEYGALYRVSSDCKPVPKGGGLGVCRACGCVQKVIDKEWLALVQNIYDSYTIYHQAEGAEQAVFEEATGASSMRSSRLLDRVTQHVDVPERGRLLDIGCGNGALMRAFSSIRPLWSLAGTELNDKYSAIVESIPRTESLYLCTPEAVPGTFGMISMVHVLEHIINPAEFLRKVWEKLETGGLLLVEVPAYMGNPFDLINADHSTHFDSGMIRRLLAGAGFEVVEIGEGWIPKELTVIARRSEDRGAIVRTDEVAATTEAVASRIRWLRDVLALSREMADRKPFGVFGTSIAATWIFAELEDRIDFFVDEDSRRTGRNYMGRPVYLPGEIPATSRVLVAQPVEIAEVLKARLEKLVPDCEFRSPSKLG